MNLEVSGEDAPRLVEGMRIEFWDGRPRWWQFWRWPRYWLKKWRARKGPHYYTVESVESEVGPGGLATITIEEVENFGPLQKP